LFFASAEGSCKGRCTEVLARHCAGASSVEKAVDYWLKAGQQAIARWAMKRGL
jgi:hypothetical protein